MTEIKGAITGPERVLLDHMGGLTPEQRSKYYQDLRNAGPDQREKWRGKGGSMKALRERRKQLGL